jgi:hypothetical protein
MGMLELQNLREFDAPALHSYKPLPCGTGYCKSQQHFTTFAGNIHEIQVADMSEIMSYV